MNKKIKLYAMIALSFALSAETSHSAGKNERSGAYGGGPSEPITPGKAINNLDGSIASLEGRIATNIKEVREKHPSLKSGDMRHKARLYVLNQQIKNDKAMLEKLNAMKEESKRKIRNKNFFAQLKKNQKSIDSSKEWEQTLDDFKNVPSHDVASRDQNAQNNPRRQTWYESASKTASRAYDYIPSKERVYDIASNAYNYVPSTKNIKDAFSSAYSYMPSFPTKPSQPTIHDQNQDTNINDLETQLAKQEREIDALIAKQNKLTEILIHGKETPQQLKNREIRKIKEDAELEEELKALELDMTN